MSYIGNPIVSTDFPVDYFSGNGSTTAFTLSVAPASVNAIDVQISGVSQSPQTYSVSGTTLTFSAAPPTGSSNIVVRHLGVAGIPNTPSAGSVVPSSIGTGYSLWNLSGSDVNYTAGNVGIGTASPATALSVQNVRSDTAGTGWFTYTASATSGKRGMRVDTNNAYCFDYYNGSAWAEQMRITSTGTVLVANGQMQVSAGSGDAYSARLSCAYNYPTVDTYLDSYAGASYSGQIMFRTNSGGGAMSERMRIDSSGYLRINNTDAGNYLLKILYNGTNQEAIGLKSTTSGGGNMMRFINSADGTVGQITTTNTNTSYVTSSDYRLKENITPMQNALNVVQRLKPVTYSWKIDGSDGQGFIAHELQEVVPECVTGEKDAVDEEGNPVYQGIDTSFLVATLTAAIQELKAELDATKAEVAALKAAV